MSATFLESFLSARRVSLGHLGPLDAIKANAPTSSTEARTWFIYALTDPFTDEIRYIGWAFDVIRRIHCHVQASKKDRTRKANWIMSLWNKHRVKPRFVILESGNTDHGWAKAEMAWIWLFTQAGARLTNATPGGDGVVLFKRSEEHKRKLGDALRGKKLTAEHRKNIGDAQRGRPGKPLTDAAKAKISAWNKSRPAPSQETRQRISAAGMGRRQNLTPEEKTKRGIAIQAGRLASRLRKQLDDTTKGLPK